MAGEDRYRELEERYEDYTVYDNRGEKIGKVDDLFIDEVDREEYIGVKMGLFGLSGTTLIPMDIVRVNERERAIEVSDTKDHVKDAPNFSDDDDITPEYEDRIRNHFGLESLQSSTERGSYGRHSGATTSGIGDQDRMGEESYRNREDQRDESAMESASASTAMTSGGMSDLETGGRTGPEDESYREGYREGFREGYREGMREGGGGDLGDREGSDPSDSTAGSGTVGGETEGRGLDQGGREGERGGRGEGTGERREESGPARVWRRIRE